MLGSQQKGFTLIELMIVIAIIGILSAIAIPAYQDYLARAQVVEALTLGSSLKGSISAYYSQSTTCPTLADLGYDSSSLRGDYVDSVTTQVKSPALCSITVTMRSTDINIKLRGKTIDLNLEAFSGGGGSTGSASWRCKSETIEQKYLPKACEGI